MLMVVKEFQVYKELVCFFSQSTDTHSLVFRLIELQT
jgi:hypothetical protein